jgi:hypothetical protein
MDLFGRSAAVPTRVGTDARRIGARRANVNLPETPQFTAQPDSLPTMLLTITPFLRAG